MVNGLDGEPVPPPHGENLLPAFANDVTVPRESLWWFHSGNRAGRVGGWKLVSEGKGAWELYDLRKDRGETHDLARELPEKARELEQVWNRRLEEFTALAKKDAPAAPARSARRARGAQTLR